MGAILGILSIINGVRQLKDDKVSGALSLFGTLGQLGKGSESNNDSFDMFKLPDVGVKRNFM